MSVQVFWPSLYIVFINIARNGLKGNIRTVLNLVLCKHIKTYFAFVENPGWHSVEEVVKLPVDCDVNYHSYPFEFSLY